MKELRFWTGAIARVRAPRLALLGTDCAVGKRTTARLLVEACRSVGLRAEMIYTGQTGGMQGSRYGFVLDATPNDFVAGELEGAIVACDEEARPDLIIIEGQSSLRNPSGPCGAELLVSAGARAAILQHAPGRPDFKGHAGCGRSFLDRRARAHPPLRRAGAGDQLERRSPRRGGAAGGKRRLLGAQLGLPVVAPLADEDGVTALLPGVQRYVAQRSPENLPR